MRKNRFYIFLSVTLILAAVVFYLERTERLSPSGYKLNIQTEKIDFLAITQKYETRFFNKKDQVWEITGSTIEADTNYIDTVVKKLSTTVFQQVAISDGASLAEFRFDQPLGIVEWKESSRLVISERKNFEGDNYFQLFENGKEYILTGSGELAQQLTQPWIFFQKKHLFDYKIDEIKSIRINSLNEKFVLNEPFPESLLSRIRSMTVQQYFEGDQPKFEKPILQVEVLSLKEFWSMKLSLNSKDKKLYAEVTVEDQKYFVEYATSYWEYFANLSKKILTEGNK